MSTPISEMQKFHFGSKILSSDGEEGILTQVGFDVATRAMTHIAIKQSRFFGKNVYLPYDTVTNATGEGVSLRILGADVLSASKNVPAGTIFFDGKSVVEANGQGASGKGTLVIVAVHPTTGVLAYVVAHNFHAGQDTFLAQEYITRLESERIGITIPDAALQTIPPYRSDSELQQEVDAVLFDFTPLHIDLKGMIVSVLDSVLYLDGNISSSLRSDIVVDQALGVKGLLEIKNNLLGDDILAASVASTLGRDERTQNLPIGVYPKLGVVRLGGAVHNQQQYEVAEEITRAFPGVRGVSNTLVVNAKTDMIHVMSPAEGGVADDLIPGKYIRHTK